MKGAAADWSNFLCSATEDPRHATGLGIHPAGKLMYYWNESYWNWASGLTVPDNQWAFMAVAVEPMQATLYVYDGNDLSTATNVAAHDALEDFDTDCRNVLGQDAKDAGYFNGVIDDVRLYNKTLTVAEIAGLGGIEDLVYVPLNSKADLVVGDKNPSDPCAPIDDQVDFRDYDILAENWLMAFLWPS